MPADFEMASASTFTPVSFMTSAMYLRDALILDFLGLGDCISSSRSETCSRASSPPGRASSRALSCAISESSSAVLAALFWVT